GIENGGILCVFPAFDTEEWTEKIRSRPQTIYSEVPKYKMRIKTKNAKVPILFLIFRHLQRLCFSARVILTRQART
ncbi:MAG: hypothetical protein ACLR40_06095, partial [Oscillospiraceae bacterium]